MSYISMRNTCSHRKINEKGLSLIEASMVLALSAIVISGTMLYYQSAAENNKIRETANLFMGVISTINTLYANNSDYKSISEEILFASTSIPEKNKDYKGKVIKNSLGGKIFIRPNEKDAKSYHIVTENLSSSACSTVGMMDFGDSLKSIGVGANGSNGPGHVIEGFEFVTAAERTPAKMNYLCTRGLDKDKNASYYVVYTMK